MRGTSRGVGNAGWPYRAARRSQRKISRGNEARSQCISHSSSIMSVDGIEVERDRLSALGGSSRICHGNNLVLRLNMQRHLDLRFRY